MNRAKMLQYAKEAGYGYRCPKCGAMPCARCEYDTLRNALGYVPKKLINKQRHWRRNGGR